MVVVWVVRRVVRYEVAGGGNMGGGLYLGPVSCGGRWVGVGVACGGVLARTRGRACRGDGTAHVPPSHEGTLHMGNNPCRLAADMV